MYATEHTLLLLESMSVSERPHYAPACASDCALTTSGSMSLRPASPMAATGRLATALACT